MTCFGWFACDQLRIARWFLVHSKYSTVMLTRWQAVRVILPFTSPDLMRQSSMIWTPLTHTRTPSSVSA
jgi:hypothetical protein